MIAGLRVLGVITARGGSKRVPGKNLRRAGGRPLLAWTVDAARQSRYIDRLVLSTDDEAIASAGRELGCEVPFLRPPALAADHTPGVEPVLHALAEIPGFDVVVLLQPTSPLRVGEDIDACIERATRAGADACVSVTPGEGKPEWTFCLDAEGRMAPMPKEMRQGWTPYFLNGAVYAARSRWLAEQRTFVAAGTVAYPMPPERSLDIDTEDDLEKMNRMLAGAGARDG
jgi:N-acylneuraminate cytidylyltransferase